MKMQEERIKNQGKAPIIILHGWSREMTGSRYSAIQEIFKANGYLVFAPDLPGFGGNPLNKYELIFDDYVLFVHDYILKILQKTKQKKVILLGHSFGGRIAIRVASVYPQIIQTLVLTGASGIPRPLPSLKKKMVFYATKIVRPFFLIPPFSIFYKVFRKLVYYSIGETDYYKAGLLTQTFKNVYKVSIVNDLEKISVPTFLIWGEKDTVTPLIDGEYMNKHILHSKFSVIPNETHRLPYENPQEFARIVLQFLV